MRKLIFLLLLIPALKGQTQTKTFDIKKADSVVFGKAQLDFAIPDIPAFKAIGADPSNMLRPSSAKQFALAFSNFAADRLQTIPRNLAMEIAPALVTNTWYTLNDYTSKMGIRFLAKTRLSLGTNEDKVTKINSVAFGLRTTLLDKGDFRKDIKFQKDSIYNKLELLHNDVDTRMENLMQTMGIVVMANLTEQRRKAIRDSIYERSKSDIGDVNSIINKAIEDYKKLNWNASRIDVAYSLLLQSPDSLVSNVKLNKHLLWATFALRPGTNNHWGQILLGVNTISYRNLTKWENEFTGNLRFYAGTNRLKGLLETQYKNKDVLFANSLQSLFSQVGVEVSPFKGIWLQFSTGLLNALEGNTRSALRSNLNISLTFPEDFKLF